MVKSTPINGISDSLDTFLFSSRDPQGNPLSDKNNEEICFMIKECLDKNTVPIFQMACPNGISIVDNYTPLQLLEASGGF